MIKIAYFGEDSGFFKGLSKYLEGTESGSLSIDLAWICSNESKFTYNASINEASPEKVSTSMNLSTYDLILLDSQYASIINNYTYEAQKCILLTDALENKSHLMDYTVQNQASAVEERGHRISKITPADELVKYIQRCLTGTGRANATMHIAIGASFSTERTSSFALTLCRNLIKQGKSVLLISFDTLATLDRMGVKSLRDPIGSLAYYALEGSSALKESMDRCTQKSTMGIDCIVSKVPFDMSQWTAQMIDALLKYFDAQVRYDAVVWMMGHTYTQGLVTIYDCADQVVWFGQEKMMESDAYYAVYMSSASRRLDLKTHYIKSERLHPEGSYEGDIDHILWRLNEASAMRRGI